MILFQVKKEDKYTSLQIQNEILSILALKISRDIDDSIRASLLLTYKHMNILKASTRLSA